jgi:hypothetical protein
VPTVSTAPAVRVERGDAMYVRVSSQATLRLVEVNDDPVVIAGVVAAKDYLALDGLMRAAGSSRGVHGSAVSNSGVRCTLRMR